MELASTKMVNWNLNAMELIAKNSRLELTLSTVSGGQLFFFDGRLPKKLKV
jgi:hypothetical protein